MGVAVAVVTAPAPGVLPVVVVVVVVVVVDVVLLNPSAPHARVVVLEQRLVRTPRLPFRGAEVVVVVAAVDLVVPLLRQQRLGPVDHPRQVQFVRRARATVESEPPFGQQGLVLAGGSPFLGVGVQGERVGVNRFPVFRLPPPVQHGGEVRFGVFPFLLGFQCGVALQLDAGHHVT